MLRLLHRVLQLGAGLQQQVGLVSEIYESIRHNVNDNISKKYISYPARALLLADGAPTVGGGKTF